MSKQQIELAGNILLKCFTNGKPFFPLLEANFLIHSDTPL